jgi:ribosomal protein L37E
MFIIFRCMKCGRYLYARRDMKARICTRCGFRNDLRKVLVVAKAEDERTAGEIVRRLQGEGTGFRCLSTYD